MATFIANGSKRVFVVRATSRYADGFTAVEDYGLRSDGKVLRRLVTTQRSGEALVKHSSGYSLTGATFKRANVDAGKVTLGVFMRYVSTRPGVTTVVA